MVSVAITSLAPSVRISVVVLTTVVSLTGLVVADEPKAKIAAAPADGRRSLDLAPTSRTIEADSATKARAILGESKIRFATVQDYTCNFYKRERFDGKLSDTNVMVMKARTRPQSVYFKFVTPSAGREVIYVAGKNKGKMVAHEAGITKVLAGTLHLDPKGDMAMGENRHPITEAGIGYMIEKVSHRWQADLAQPGTQVVIHPNAKVGERSCTILEEIHTKKNASLVFARVRIYIDHEMGIPIRYEGYGWADRPGMEPELLEEYTFMNLRLNVGLTDRDFDPANTQYSFGRF